MVAVGVVATDKTFTDVEILGREGVGVAVFEKIRGAVGCVLDETSTHGMLRHCFAISRVIEKVVVVVLVKVL